MNTEELLRCVQSDNVLRQNFKEVLPRDKLPKKVVKQFPVSYIVNTDTSREEGKHWVTVYLENDEWRDFFDSYGNPPSSLAEEFEKFLKRNVVSYSFKDRRLQGAYSTVCGQFCLFYLYHRCRVYYTREIIRMFGKDADINDVLDNKIINEKYDAQFKVTDLEYLVNQIARPFKESSFNFFKLSKVLLRGFY